MVPKNRRQVSDIDLSMDKNPLTGDVALITNKNAIKRSLKNLFLFRKYEKPFQYNLYSGIPELLFDNALADTEDIIKKRVSFIVEAYEPRVKLGAVRVSLKPNTNEITISIEYSFGDLFTDNFSMVVEREDK